ncbi:head maturation protease, ClpP-related [Anaeromyxobacter sp. PSR-1]|uniref:head maturation protease, ClpP-related n=1 Tax=Anaeromyxobacter sp. PSR-1 TaxID=1300915 RepID=UPI0005E5ADC7|nr:head maturation protease, ClpP-related [Anaeromyxobacter sp. PSR-1]GAO01956.1 ATP-dependent Clp protease proteolytic subunit 2 [Anaeromyxobacter sp. PSR-1]
MNDFRIHMAGKAASLRRLNPEGLVQMRGDTAQLFLYGDIGPVFGGIGAQQVAEELGKVRASQLDLFINSDGGDAFEGVAIYNVLSRFGGRITAYVDGLAASIASVILQAGHERVMMPGSQVMVHGPWMGVMGNSADLRAAADKLDLTAKSVASIYEERTGQPSERVGSWLSGEHFFSAEDAVSNGLADRISGAPTAPTNKASRPQRAGLTSWQIAQLRSQGRRQ